ncbi:MAG: glycosyltransferase family 4 protein [bacterium]|nr:glycosyltransferase family 4 protein [bacterium]
MLQIALLSYHFFNYTAEGFATAKLARALTDAGHRVAVFTSRENWLEGDCLRPTAGPLAAITVHRVEADPAVAPGWRALEARSARTRLEARLAAVPNLLHGCSVGEWAWAVTVAEHTARIWAGDGPFDLLHTRLNHPVSHLAGLLLARKIPALAWCAYFSDPWPFHLYPAPYRSRIGRLSRWRLERLLERILRTAGSCVFPAERLRDHQLSGRRARFRERAVVAAHLTNVWHRSRLKAKGPTLRILHTGFLMKERRIEPLLEGLRRLRGRRDDVRRNLRLEFIGRFSELSLPQAPEDLRETLIFHTYVRPEKVWAWLQEADVLLLVEADMEQGIFFPSKLADYLGAGRPILALSPEHGVAADLLAHGGGLRVGPEDVEGIARALERLMDAWEDGTLSDLAPTVEQVRLVSPEHVVPQYERAFERAIAHAGGRK